MTRTRPDEEGQALLVTVVLISVALFVTFGFIATSTQQQLPIVRSDLVEHAAYRAAQAGLNEYLYKINDNANYVNCNSSNQGNGYCQGLQFGVWQAVPGAGASSGMPEWFLYGDPTINKTASPATVSISVVGAAGFPGNQSYQTVKSVFSAENGFLQNLYWMDHDVVDPSITNPGSNATCAYDYYDSTTCLRIDFISSDVINGSLFSNDAVYVCGSPAFGNVVTADPNATLESVFEQASGCSATSAPTCSGTVAACSAPPNESGVQREPIPSDNQKLYVDGVAGGCVYSGPTEITFLSGGKMQVWSPGTPAGTPSGAPNGSVANDLNEDAGDPSQCLPTGGNPQTSGTAIPTPSNGVIFVQNCPASQTAGCTATYNSGLGEDGSTGSTVGDAIVQGTVTGPVTVGADNNIIIDGNLTYANGTAGTDVLGLVAYNFVEVNHPVDSQGNNDALCTTQGVAPTNQAPLCDNTNYTINAAILTLKHSFAVTNHDQGSPLGTLTVNGAIAQEYRGAVGTHDSNGNVASGYSKNYNYDSRFAWLSPPYYLSPGTQSWGLGSFTASPGKCVVNGAACAALPTPTG